MFEKYKFISEIKGLHFVKKVVLYGSRARGDNSPRSDIDLAIDASGATEVEWRRVIDIIENVDTLLRIDLVRIDKLRNDKLLEDIKKEGIEL